jgi:hypothetical protein
VDCGLTQISVTNGQEKLKNNNMKVKEKGFKQIDATRKMMTKALSTGTIDELMAATMLRRLLSRPKRRRTRKARRTWERKEAKEGYM